MASPELKGNNSGSQYCYILKLEKYEEKVLRAQLLNCLLNFGKIVVNIKRH